MKTKENNLQQFYEQLTKIKSQLQYYKKPFILYDDDPDGLSAFLLLYRYLKEGKHYPVKSSPEVGTFFVPKIKEYDPDVVIVLDKPLLSDAFVDAIAYPIVWFDHHTKEKRQESHVKEINPRDYGIEQYATTHIIYDMVKRPQDLWIGLIGTIGDWTLPLFLEEGHNQYSDLVPQTTDVPKLLFASPLGRLIKIFSFLLKLPSQKYKKHLKTLIELTNPYDLLEGKTEATRKLLKAIKPIEEEYNQLLMQAEEQATAEEILFFPYESGKQSFTKELSNELLFKYPNKVIIIGRKKDGSIKLSLRASHYHLPSLLEQALRGVHGHGGGHEHACGANIKLHDFPLFLEQLKKAITKLK